MADVSRDEVEPPTDRFFEMSLELLAVAGTDGFFRRLNPAWEPTLGWTSDELYAQPIVSLVHPDDVDSTLAEVGLLAEGQDTVSFVNRYRCKDGSYRQLQWSATADGDTMFAVARDITELRTATDQLRGSEDLLAAVLHTAVDPIILIDTQGTMLQVNSTTSALFGYSEAELLGNNVTMLMPEPYRSEHDAYIERYLATNDPHIIGIGREVSARKADGTVFPMRLAVSEAATPQGRVFAGVIHDLTEARRAQDLLERANAELEERVADRTRALEQLNIELARSNRDLEQFAYIASHDLQAPLRNVRQGMDLLDEHLADELGVPFDDEANELRSLINGAVTRMEVMIRGLLSYSRVHRRDVATGHSVDLTEVAADVVNMLRLELDEADVTVMVDDLPTVDGDPTLLTQLLQNLVQNAIKYRAPDRSSEIHLAAERVDNEWMISVTDNGIGISPDMHDRIFELFRRGHSGYDGVGIGLAISQRIVERHGGEISVTSQPGLGSTFTFSLPAS